MKSLIERQLYRPALVLPLMGLTRLLVSTDFNLTQAGFVMAMRGSQQVLALSSRVPATLGAKARQWSSRRSAAAAKAGSAVPATRASGAQPSDCCHCGC